MKKILIVSLMALMSLTSCKKEKVEEDIVQEEVKKEKDDLFTGEPLEKYPEDDENNKKRESESNKVNDVNKDNNKEEVKEEYKEIFERTKEEELMNDDGKPIGAKVGTLEMDSKDANYDFLYNWYTTKFLPSGDSSYYIYFTDKPGRGVYANSEGFFVDVLFSENKTDVDWKDESYQSYVRNPLDKTIERIK